MANDAHICFTGYVATEPTYWPNQEGRSKAILRVAYTPRHVDRDTGEWADSPTSFVSVTCWRKLADNVAMCVHKGEPVLIRGRMSVRQYDDKNGNSRVSVDVDAHSIGHDLSRGATLFQRTRRVSAGAGAAMPGADGAAGTDPALAGAPGLALPGGLAAGSPGAGPADGDDLLDDSAVAALLAEDGPGADDDAPAGDAGLGEAAAAAGDAGLREDNATAGVH